MGEGGEQQQEEDKYIILLESILQKLLNYSLAFWTNSNLASSKHSSLFISMFLPFTNRGDEILCFSKEIYIS